MARHPTFFVKIVRNQSSSWIKKRVAVLHSTEGPNLSGIQDLQNLASWFNNPSAQASAHKGIDAAGNKVTMVSDSRKAWHVGPSNSWCLGIEQVGFAASSKKYWIRDYHNGLVTVAKQLADWSIKLGIPLKVSRWKGVSSHAAMPGDHWDPGPNYPMEYVLTLAQLWRMRKKHAARNFPRQYNGLVRKIHRAQARSGVPKSRRTVNWR